MPVRSAKVFSMGIDSAPMKADKTSSTVTADWTPFEPRGAMRSKARIDNEWTDHSISTSLVSVSARAAGYDSTNFSSPTIAVN